MTPKELDALLGEWEEACVFAHGGRAHKTPNLCVAKLIAAGDKLGDALKENNERIRIGRKAAGKRSETRGRISPQAPRHAK